MTPEQAFFFDLRGYLVLERAIAPAVCAELEARMMELEGSTTEELPEGAYASASPGVNEYRIYNVISCGAAWERFIDHPTVMPYVAALVPAPYRLVEAYTVTRRDGIGIPLHSLWQAEYGTLPGPRPSTKYLKAIVCLGPVGPDDGPMVVIEGSHRLRAPFPYSPVHPDWVAPEHDAEFQAMLLAQIPDDALRVPWEQIPGYKEVEVGTGDVILFTEDLWHGAKAKESPTPRRSLYVSYCPYHFPNWHGFPYAKSLLARVTTARRNLLAGPMLGNRHEDHPLPELAQHPSFYYMPHSERFKSDPRSWRAQ